LQGYWSKSHGVRIVLGSGWFEAVKHAVGDAALDGLAAFGVRDRHDRGRAAGNEQDSAGAGNRANTRRQRRPHRCLFDQVRGAPEIRPARYDRRHLRVSMHAPARRDPAQCIRVTPRAVLAFHAAWDPSLTGAQTNAPGTKYLWSRYPDGVRRWIARHGGLQSKTIYLGGRELTAMFPSCR